MTKLKQQQNSKATKAKKNINAKCEKFNNSYCEKTLTHITTKLKISNLDNSISEKNLNSLLARTT